MNYGVQSQADNANLPRQYLQAGSSTALPRPVPQDREIVNVAQTILQLRQAPIGEIDFARAVIEALDSVRYG